MRGCFETDKPVKKEDSAREEEEEKFARAL